MDTWTQGTSSVDDWELGFRAGYQAGFGKAFQGLVVTVPSGWRAPDADDPGWNPNDLDGGRWQAGFREGWHSGCRDGYAARKGDERLGEDI